MKNLFSPLLLAAALVLALASPGRAEDQVDLALSPADIAIGTTFDGTTLSVTGGAPADCEVVVRYVGQANELHMKQKGKALGLLWMNLGSLTFEGAPSVYLVGAAGPLSGPVDAAFGLEGLAGRIRLESGAGDPAVAVRELIHLKQQEGLYQMQPGVVAYGPVADGRRPFTATLRIPSRLSPGTYSVEALAVRGDALAARAERAQAVRLVSAPAMLADLAFGHGALYGVLATIIALLSGLAIGLVFQSRGAH
jgi:hypothetical protein